MAVVVVRCEISFVFLLTLTFLFIEQGDVCARFILCTSKKHIRHINHVLFFTVVGFSECAYGIYDTYIYLYYM